MKERYDEYDRRSLLQDVTPVKGAPILGYNWKNFFGHIALVILIYWSLHELGYIDWINSF